LDYRISTADDARLRIDKWLWAARFFKTRSLAADAVLKARVRLAGEPTKPSKEIRVGDVLIIEIERLLWHVEVKGLCEVRGPASVAQTLYEETAESRKQRELERLRRKTYREPAATLHGRPTKRDRRVIDKFSNED
jgi:ribosome-associated heat shock protein Hsp15